MNRFLTSVAAMALVLALCGTAKADRFDHERLERDRIASCERGALPYFDGWWQFDWDRLWYFDHWRFGPDRDDLRHFDDLHDRWVRHYCCAS